MSFISWILFKTGRGASSHFEAGGFIRSRAGVEHPDLQYHFLPIAMNYDGSHPAGGPGFPAHVAPMPSQSRGATTLKSADPNAAPRIFFNYLSQEADPPEFLPAARLTPELFAAKAID